MIKEQAPTSCTTYNNYT